MTPEAPQAQRAYHVLDRLDRTVMAERRVARIIPEQIDRYCRFRRARHHGRFQASRRSISLAMIWKSFVL
jgi:hypothetical protein